jgi:hypothetical protein
MYEVERFFKEKHQRCMEIVAKGGEILAHPLVQPVLLTGVLSESSSLRRFAVAQGWGRQDGDREAANRWWEAGWESNGRRKRWAYARINDETRARAERRRVHEALGEQAIPEGCELKFAKAAFYTSMQSLFLRPAVARPPITHWFGKDIDADQLSSEGQASGARGLPALAQVGSDHSAA